MKLYKIIAMGNGEKVETSQSLHICGQDSYGIAASKDGEAILAAGSGFVSVAAIDEGRFSFHKGIDCYGADSCFTGHLGAFNIPLKV